MKRKILSLILAFAMTVSLLTVGTGAVEPTYGDTAGHWAESSIERWSAYGIIQGSNGLFDPNGQLTCAQLATILAKLLKLPAAKDAGFTDNTADAWYYDAINRCAAAGILNGNGDGTVTPDAPITRERAMVMLARALGIEPIRKPDLTKYTDAAQVSAYAQGYVAALIEAGIVGGVTADELAPQDNINRASTVTILDRAISTYADQAGATVKADGKGIVLVVAENVKITGAPEGTKIVVADGATGLTVNGKSVSDDQTYIVPKTTTGSGSSSGGYSHSHSYDTTTHKCSCGEFDPAVVATIGDETGYLTLKDAVAAVEDGGTIKLIKDTTGTGIGTYTTPQTDAEGNLQISAKSFTIDFSNHTYTVNSPAVGSNGFETQGFHFEKSATTNPEIILRNGKIVAAENSGEDMAMLIMNYCSLTLTNMVIDGSNLKDAYYGTGPDRAPGPNYTLSNSSHNAAKTLIQNTEIIARSGENNVAFDSDYTSHVTVAGSSIIRGKFEVGRNASLVIIGGTFSSNPSAYVPEGYEATKSETEEIWTVGEGSNPLVAEINGVKYISLPKALTAAKNGDTVKLVGDTTLRSSVEINKSITLDLNGKAIHYTGETQDSATQTHRALNVTDGNVTIKSGSITTTVAGTDYSTEFDAVVVKSGADVTLKDMNITINDAKGSCLYVFEGGKATVKSGSYTNTNTSGEKLLLNQKDNKPQAIFVEGGTFDGRNPESGDNSGNPSTFLAPDYKSVETSAGSGVWTVSKMTWDEYPEDASVVPSGLVITEYPQNAFDSSNGKTGTITIKDKDALLYFAYRLDLAKAYAECGEKAHGTGWGHTCIWYGGAYARHIVLDANIDLGGMTLENGFGNMKDFAFDGHNHKISNVTINYTGTGNTGLFVGGNRGISNLVVENVNVIAPNGTENAVGIVSSDANADITNVTVRNSSVTGGKFTGAIVGYNYGSVKDCKVENCTVSGRYKVGGIIGYICNSNDVPTYVTGNDLTGVTVKGEKLVAGKDDFVIGKIVGNWNATIGECSSNTFTAGTTDAAEDIGEIESRCIVTVNGALHCTLAQFNALTSIPAAAKKVYVDLGNVSLANGDVTIGNKDICDKWTWDRETNHTAGEVLADGRKVYMVRDTDTIYSSNKAGITLYISGSVNENPEGGLNQSDSHAITFSIPDASDVVFTKDFTMNGYFRMNAGWSDGRNLGGAVYNRTVKSVLFDHSTFNGIWIQNGGFFTDRLTLDGCTFNAYENKVSANDSNPLWFCNIRTCNVTVKNCIFKASRPIKVVEQGVFGANVTITDNKFDMSLTNSADDASKPKNDAIMFSTLIGETQWNPAGTLGNVVVSGNEITGATALLTFFKNTATCPDNPSQITMAEEATFTVSGNTLNGAKLSVEWKTATEYTPNFVTVN